MCRLRASLSFICGLLAQLAVAAPAAADDSPRPPPPVPPIIDGTFDFTHPPYTEGACDICHVRADINDAGPARESMSDICFSCHVDLLNAIGSDEYIHQPMREGCQYCHNPHNSTRPSLLVDEPQALCTSCHEDVAREVKRAKVSHGALTRGNSCVNCHDPHGSNAEKLLAELPYDLCVKCHSVDAFVDKHGKPMLNFKRYLAENPNHHSPVKNKECSACHRPHGARYHRLLIEDYPATLYTAYRREKYALCYVCHSHEAIEEKQTRLTGFRNEEKNIHRAHVVDQQPGRSCRACHAVHASKQEFHIRESLPYGTSGWELQLNFAAGPDGGSCQKTCHETRVYQRGEFGLPTVAGLTARPRRTVDDREIDLARKGEVTVLAFFKPDQDYSAMALRQIEQCGEHFPRDKARIVGVVRSSYSAGATQQALAAAGLGIDVIADEGSEIEITYGIKAHPFFVLIDERGRMVGRQAISKANLCLPLIQRVLYARGEITKAELEQAIQPQQIVVSEDQATADRYLGLATVLLKSRRYADAQEMTEIALSHDPASGAAHALLRAIRGAEGDRPQLEVPRAVTRPSVDGDLTEYADAPEIKIRAGRAVASYRALWDDSALYLAARVEDESDWGRHGGRARERDLVDRVGWWLDPRHDRSPSPDEGDRRYALAATGELTATDGEGKRFPAFTAAGSHAVGPGSDGEGASYDAEIAVPWSALGTEPAVGALLGVDLTLDDAGFSKVTSTNWSGVAGFEAPADWNEIVLVGPVGAGDAAVGADRGTSPEPTGPPDRPEPAAGCGCATTGRASSALEGLAGFLALLISGAVLATRGARRSKEKE